MKNFLFGIFLLFFSSGIYCQNYKWAKSIGGKGSDNAVTILTYQQRDVYILGSFRDTVDFDSGSGVHKLIATNTDGDTFLLKLDSLGNFIWVKHFEGTGYTSARSMTQDFYGNLFIMGSYGGNIDFDPGSGTFNLPYSFGYSGLFVVALNSAGIYKWAKGIGSVTNFIYGTSVDCDSLGHIYFTGTFSTYSNMQMNITSPQDFDPGSGTFTLTTINGANNAFIAKWDTAGNFIWTKRLEFGGSHGSSIDANNQGDIYIGGHFSGNVDFDPGIGALNLNFAGSADIFILKLSTGGNLVWAKAMGGSSDDYATNLKLDMSGNICAVGCFGGTADLDPSPGIDNHLAGGNRDIFLSKLDSNGNYLFSKTLGDLGDDYSAAIAIDKFNNIYLSGSYQYNPDFDPGAGAYFQSATGFGENFILKLDMSGNFVSVKNLHSQDSSGFSYGACLFVDNSQNVYNVGMFNKTADFNPDLASVNLTSLGDWEAFILKLGPCELDLNQSANTTICNGESTKLNADNAFSYLWQPGGLVSNSIIVNPTITTQYTVTGVLATDCKKTNTVLVTVAMCTGFRTDSILKNFLNVYPNPSNGDFSIIGSEQTSIKVLNELGQELLSQKLDEKNNYSARISNLENGVYFIVSEKGCQKIIVTK